MKDEGRTTINEQLKPKKVLILYSTGGMGHKKAADALYRAFRKRPGVEAKNVDTLDYASKLYKFIYTDCYVYLMGPLKLLWGALYYLSDVPFLGRFMMKVREKSDFRNLQGLTDMLIKESPDAIVTTHFILQAVMKVLKKEKSFKARTYVVITDYGPHSFWLSDDIDKFFVGSDSVVSELLKRGVPAENAVASGIPTTEEFSKGYDKKGMRERYGLDKEKRTVFILSGGFGVGPMESILRSLDLCRADMQVITVCGHNKKAYDDIDVLRKSLKYPVILFGFTDKVAELMSASDLMITKAGGISVTEALDMGLPMILFASVPGQETWNEKFLVGAGAAKKAGSVKEIPVFVDELLMSDDKIGAMRKNIEKICHPRAAEEIVDVVMKEI